MREGAWSEKFIEMDVLCIGGDRGLMRFEDAPELRNIRPYAVLTALQGECLPGLKISEMYVCCPLLLSKK